MAGSTGSVARTVNVSTEDYESEVVCADGVTAIRVFRYDSGLLVFEQFIGSNGVVLTPTNWVQGGCGAGRINLGSGVFTFDDALGVTGWTVPAGANHAEVQIEFLTGASYVRFTTGGTTPNDGAGIGYKQGDGQVFELESEDEVNNFLLIGAAGVTGLIYVEFALLTQSGDAND